MKVVVRYDRINGRLIKITETMETDIDSNTDFVINRQSEQFNKNEQIALLQGEVSRLQALIDSRNDDILTLQNL